MKSLSSTSVSRRQAIRLGLGSVAAAGVVALAGCTDTSNDSTATTSSSSSASSSSTDSTASTQIDKDAFDSLLAAGDVADDATVSGSTWAQKIKDAGTFRLGGVQTSTLFASLDETDNKLRGFDAGLAQLLVRYILGDESKYEFTKVTSDTRESVLQNDQVDAVFATYSITDKRKEVISFAGPYYSTQQGILVLADNSDINSVDDLAGKTVAAQSGSTGPSILAEYAPTATVQEFTTDEEARTALEQGRVDAYVIDATMQMSSIVKNPGKYRLAGDSFGPEDPYGIGLQLDSDGVAFVNTWLKKIEDEGTWAKLWKICIGDRTGIDKVPEPPAIGA
jgi:glutamate transport system substrate-binding protein